MMNRIETLFRQKQGNILSIYLTAGYPHAGDLPRLLEALTHAGVDMAEVGMPFSDPLADGPVIQQSSQVALENGMTLSLLFEQVKKAREKVSMPLILMGYLNPVLQYGMTRFLTSCRESGIDGVIIPDLPLEEFVSQYEAEFREAGVSFSMLITPQTGPERVRKIGAATTGFLYMVADSSTTGVREGISERQIAYFQRIREMSLGIPRLIGFGISNAETFSSACRYADGAIIGSAFIRALADTGDMTLEERVKSFIQSVRSGHHH